MNETNEKKENDQEPKIPATPATPKRICDSRCKICNSDFIEKIHKLKKAGHTFDQISEIAKKELNFEISKSSLSRHFKNYQRHKDLISAEIINNDLIAEATKQAIHTKKLVGLIDTTFEQIKIQLAAGSLRLGVDSLEKLMKLRYQVMSGQDTDEKDILAIFQKATDKYGVDLNQGVLFKK